MSEWSPAVIVGALALAAFATIWLIYLFGLRSWRRRVPPRRRPNAQPDGMPE